MKICITATGEGLDAKADPHFGRCGYFVIVDSETGAVTALENSGEAATGGAGIQAAQTVAKEGINILLTGSVGPNAFKILSEIGIEVRTGEFGTVADVLEQYRAGTLERISSPTAPEHSGLK